MGYVDTYITEKYHGENTTDNIKHITKEEEATNKKKYGIWRVFVCIHISKPSEGLQGYENGVLSVYALG